MGLGRDLDTLFLDELLVGFANQRFERLLTDCLTKFLADDCRGRLSGTKARQSDCGRVAARRLVLRIPHDFHRNRDLNVALDSFRSPWGELDFHVGNITEWQSPASARRQVAEILP